MSRRNLPGGKGLTEVSNLPSIYRRPARAAFVRGPGGETPAGRGLSAWWGPRWKMDGKRLRKLRTLKTPLGDSKGAFSLW